ncbi:T9SS type A sorting domain-containing protein [Aquimarina sp. RZ0]|uniref:T9SS type A sorting domain-containing protein n=1 Tax=Aquimarina sp. RZ0 TaxID=2607730 RepID=UPI0011F1C765|nr:T9SS type A sorting domain-containing protein [Aquimarina sp. RZ0]KAA1243505.1 T9SS type A sorting domain-containing protein [Aquimarina sp. RZ0]
MKTQFLLSIIFFKGIMIYCQTNFQKTYGGSNDDFGLSAHQTTDGGYILFGQTSSFGNGFQDMYLVKTDAQGDEQWSKTYGGTDWEFGISAQQTKDGGYILCGAYGGIDDDFLSLIKTDPDGNEIWNKKYSGTVDRDVGQFVQQTIDGGFIAVGFTGASPNEHIYMVKTDRDGNEEWSKVHTSIGKEHAAEIRQTSDEGYIIIGETNSKGSGGKDMYLVKTDKVGEIIWTKTYGTPSDEIGRSLYITSDNGFILLGYEDSDKGNLYLVKTDSLGNEQWSNYYGNTGRDLGQSIQQTLDEGYILAGRKENLETGTNDLYAIKINDTGIIGWERTFPRGVFSEANSVQQTSDGGYILFGYAVEETDSNMYLVKIDETGLLSIDDINQRLIDVSVYPNPFTEYTTVGVKDYKNRNFSITLYNHQGQIVRLINDIRDRQIRIERNNLASGMYFFQVSTADTPLLKTGKLIVK